MRLILSVVFLISAVTVRGDETVTAMVTNAFNKCREQFPISDGELEGVKDKTTVPDSHNAKCLMACMLKEGKIMRDGLYVKGNALVMADILNKDQPAIAEKARQLVETCVDEVGTDASADECEFAYKMAVCAATEAKKLGVHPPDF